MAQKLLGRVECIARAARRGITQPFQTPSEPRRNRTEPRRLLFAEAELLRQFELRDGDRREAAGDSEAQREEVNAETRADLWGLSSNRLCLTDLAMVRQIHATLP